MKKLEENDEQELEGLTSFELNRREIKAAAIFEEPKIERER